MVVNEKAQRSPKPLFPQGPEGKGTGWRGLVEVTQCLSDTKHGGHLFTKFETILSMPGHQKYYLIFLQEEDIPRWPVAIMHSRKAAGGIKRYPRMQICS